MRYWTYFQKLERINLSCCNDRNFTGSSRYKNWYKDCFIFLSWATCHEKQYAKALLESSSLNWNWWKWRYFKPIQSVIRVGIDICFGAISTSTGNWWANSGNNQKGSMLSMKWLRLIFMVAHQYKALNPYLTKLDLCSTQPEENIEKSGMFYRPKMFRLDPEKAKDIQV